MILALLISASIGCIVGYFMTIPSCCWFRRHQWQLDPFMFVPGQLVQYFNCTRCGDLSVKRYRAPENPYESLDNQYWLGSASARTSSICSYITHDDPR